VEIAPLEILSFNFWGREDMWKDCGVKTNDLILLFWGREDPKKDCGVAVDDIVLTLWEREDLPKLMIKF
jgi:hypothetical protein